MIEYKFWKDWDNINLIEERAIQSVDKAINILFETINKNNLSSIYIKGTFTNREMNEKSDVDIVPITKNNETLEKIKKLQEIRGKEYKPSEFVPHSTWEFENQKKYNKKKRSSENPDQVIRNIHFHKLIWGKPLETEKYNIRDDPTRLKGHIKGFETKFIPLYREGEVSFNAYLKQVFWLTINEQRIKGNDPPFSWKGLDELVKNPNHIIHEATQLRLTPTNNSETKEEFVQKSIKYVNELKNLI